MRALGIVEIGATRSAATTVCFVLVLSAALPATPRASAGEAAQPPNAQTSEQPSPDQNDSILKKALKALNIASDPGEPQDFVRQTRPPDPDDEKYVPVFRQTSEHKAKLLTPDQLKSLETDLDAAQTRNAQIRDAFPPARRAYLEEQKEKAQKQEAKRASKTGPTAATQ